MVVTSNSSNTSPVSPIAGYKVLRVLGKGAFGTVSKVMRIIDGKILVWKVNNKYLIHINKYINKYI